MASQQEREAFLRGWRAAMDEVLAVLAAEASDWEEEEREASAAGQYKLPGSFALEEVQGSFRGRHDLLAWITQHGPAAGHQGDSQMASALDALIEGRAGGAQLRLLGLSSQPAEQASDESESEAE